MIIKSEAGSIVLDYDGMYPFLSDTEKENKEKLGWNFDSAQVEIKGLMKNGRPDKITIKFIVSPCNSHALGIKIKAKASDLERGIAKGKIIDLTTLESSKMYVDSDIINAIEKLITSINKENIHNIEYCLYIILDLINSIFEEMETGEIVE